jgi:hypothetical protein
MVTISGRSALRRIADRLRGRPGPFFQTFEGTVSVCERWREHEKKRDDSMNFHRSEDSNNNLVDEPKGP